ncbi:MAG: adenylate/guanylate cyclase domain-containing protein [Candidatus Dadabacteria bacterium]|nr:MAG: adenylate/guanylate cyclase domain-containing protein [Candidatus Dadabacteria bacterium]
MGFGTNMNKLGSGVSFLLVAIFVLVSILVSVFSSYYFTSTLSEQKAQELVQLFSAPDTSFDETAKNILNSRQDVLYIKLLDSKGVLQESFGSDEGENIEMFPITTSENSTILLGLVGTDFKNLIIYPALWSALIGLVVSIIVLFILSLLSNGKSDSIEKIISGMKRVSRGDSTTKLESSEAGDDVTMIRAYETFNQMLDMLKRRENVEVEEPIFQPTLIATEEKEEETNTRRVTVIVAKIADFQDLSSTLDSTEFNSFLADYRKSASSIISNYGGVIEALMKEEIVAFFNAPEEQTNPELRAICSAVEVLQHLATITRERKLEGKIAINGKIGIGTKTLNVYSDSGVPQGIKGVTDTARSICDISPIWRVIVSSELYLSVSEYVEARELTLGEESYYSIVGVEEGIV